MIGQNVQDVAEKAVSASVHDNMKTTLELYNLNPQEFKTLLYPEVLELKYTEMQARYNTAVTEMFDIGFGSLTKAQKDRKVELDAIVAEATKALAYIKLWREEMY